MSETLKQLEALGKTGDWVFHGSPLSPEELDMVELEDGSYGRALRPSIPRNFNRSKGVFEAHSEFPVVCATMLFPVNALHRALCHPANHQDVPEELRGHGFDEEGSPVITVALLDSITSQPELVAYAHRLKRTPDFRLFPGEADEWRSPKPAKIEEAYSVTPKDMTYPLIVR